MFIVREKFKTLLTEIQQSSVITKPNTPILSRVQKDDVLAQWKTFLDYVLVTDDLYQRFDAPGHKSQIKKDALRAKYATFMIEYRYAMAIIFEFEKNAKLHKILNEPIPALGLPADTYSKLKFRFLNVAMAAEFSQLSLIYKSKQFGKHPLNKIIKEDSGYIWKAAKSKGPYETLKNGVVVTQDGFRKLIYPVQKNALMLGKYKVNPFEDYYISGADRKEIQAQIEPGDILVTRREWHVSNLGIPGFWTHAALYVGTPAQRRNFFSQPAVQSWVKEMGEPSGKFEKLLARQYPKKYPKMISKTKKDYRVIESYDPGVSLTELDFTLDADSVAGIRPNVDKLTKAKAIYNAFNYLGRPYDFDFNFETDSKLVCTELVAKSYDIPGTKLTFYHSKAAGKNVIAPNDLIRQVDAELGLKNPTFTPLFFYDGNAKTNQSHNTSFDVLRESWKRPKWHILTTK